MEDFRTKKGFISKLPPWIKAGFVKFWFAGAVFYFIGWGLSLQTYDQLNLTLALGLVLGLVTELVINRLLVYLESSKKEYRKFLFCYSPKFYFLPVNLIYGIVIAMLISYTYHYINYGAILINGYPQGHIVLGAEPILYGLFFVIFDTFFVSVKRLIKKILNLKGTRNDIQ